MKTQTKQTLDFTKKSITELTVTEAASINGGTGFICSNCMTISEKSITIIQ
ncbi:hypothetical protein [Lacinutrix sp. Hel_I_90]|uniref:hypothetical protein n=1 Tax=Lacinutrix sp. Hel_I_90 TaxID=1249999 RepID=UPI000AFFF647|nr:hypothetical protein [Lacinutrix sp. Hel_I_90]